jgi:CheY-like chemotaxis protein
MGRVLVLEPYEGIRAVIETVVRLLGHEPVVAALAGSREELGPLDAVVVEPAAPAARTLLEALLDEDPTLPVVCVSIEPEGADLLPVEPVAYLVKPFGVPNLSAALERALAGRS